MKKIIVFTALILLLANTSVFCYDNVHAHRDFNKAIVEKFLTKYSNYNAFKNYLFGLNTTTFKGPAVIAPGNLSVTEGARDYTIKDWIIEGGYSADEPELPAALRHFYDPLAINEGKYYLTDLKSDVVNPAIDALYWHFDGSDAIDGDNNWSWKQGKNYLEASLETSDESQKSDLIAKAFRSLGEVLHNTADMGCPPHVRNDAHGGYPGVGGSDPYESGFKPDWIYSFSTRAPENNISSFFNSSDKALEINKKLAEFTNKYFFSNETISGTGVENYHSSNGMPDYPYPKLDKLIYDPLTFDYSISLPSGDTVTLCNDQSVFMGYISQNFRSYPRVTQKNVLSQAKRLVPNIIAAGVNIIRTFIPELEVKVEANLSDNKLTGKIIHTANNEYPDTISYSGIVKFYINNKSTNIAADAKFGEYNITSKEFKSGDKIRAYITFADITVQSDEITVSDNVPYEELTFNQTCKRPTLVEQIASWDIHLNGPNLEQNFNYSGTLNAPKGTYINDISNYDGDISVNIFCINDKEIDVTLKLSYDFVPNEWKWKNSVSGDTTTFNFKFLNDYYTVLNNNGYDREVFLPDITLVQFNSILREYTYTFKFDPKVFFKGDPITEGLHIALNPKLQCTPKDKWKTFDDNGNVWVPFTFSNFHIVFWQHYPE